MSKVSEIVIKRFLSYVDEIGCMPWQQPYRVCKAFNYFTEKQYSGINSIILPAGEYVTKKQVDEYNKANKETFRFQKGIVWLPVVFFTTKNVKMPIEDLLKVFPKADVTRDGMVGFDSKGITYSIKDGEAYKSWNVMRYFSVADIKHFKNDKGLGFPSKVQSGKIKITMSSPQKVYSDYIKREGLAVDEGYYGTPSYSFKLDLVRLNPYTSDECEWFSTAFHELAHSTGHSKRLSRDSLLIRKADNYAIEECIAEITSSMVCSYCGVHTFSTSGTKAFANNLAYVSMWKKQIKSWDNVFVYVVSQADKAYNYIIGNRGN